MAIPNAPYYVGREQLRRTLSTGVVEGRSFAVVGGPKSGRTLTLQVLEAELRERLRRQPNVTKVVPIALDLNNFAGQPTTTFLKTLWQTLTSALYHGSVVGSGKLPKPITAPVFLKQDAAWNAMGEGLALLDERLSGSGAYCHWVLLLDGADALLTPERREDLQGLGAWLKDKAPGSPYSVILAGGRRTREALWDKKHPLHSLRPVLLENLRDSEARAFCKHKGVGLSDEEYKAVCDISGRQPFMLALLLDVVARGAPRPLDIESLLPDIWDHLAPWFVAIWNELDRGRKVTYRGTYAAPEHAFLQLLLDEHRAMPVRDVEKQLRAKHLAEFGELLCYLGLVEKLLTRDTPAYNANFEMWNRWYVDRIRH